MFLSALGEGARVSGGEPLRRYEVLAYLLERLVRHEGSPSYGNVAGRLGVSRERAKQLMGQLIGEGLVRKPPGEQRCFVVVDVVVARARVVDALKAHGSIVSQPLGRLECDGGFPLGQLPMMPDLEHLPDLDWPGDIAA